MLVSDVAGGLNLLTSLAEDRKASDVNHLRKTAAFLGLDVPCREAEVMCGVHNLGCEKALLPDVIGPHDIVPHAGLGILR
jgi:hypothetical protein